MLLAQVIIDVYSLNTKILVTEHYIKAYFFIGTGGKLLLIVVKS